MNFPLIPSNMPSGDKWILRYVKKFDMHSNHDGVDRNANKKVWYMKEKIREIVVY